MDDGTAYSMLDAGDGRRLERFGGLIVDRPAPTAIAPVREPETWVSADARFDRSERGDVQHAGWTTRDGAPIEPWVVQEDGLAFELRLAASGQVGLFPEQAPNRRWIGERVAEQVARRRARSRGGTDEGAGQGPDILNLFGYTGGSTLAAVAADGRATHLDASRPSVAWARRNADLNGFADRPVRWIADDASAFVRREVKRGRRYTGVVLDPPSYGHGAGGREWRLERDLPPLLADCGRLVGGAEDAFIALTAHTPGAGGEVLAEWLAAAVPRGEIAVDELGLRAATGTRLLLGWSIRWTREHA